MYFADRGCNLYRYATETYNDANSVMLEIKFSILAYWSALCAT